MRRAYFSTFKSGRLIWPLLLGLLCACGSSPAGRPGLRVVVATQLRQIPEASGTPLQGLSKGAVLFDLGEVSPYLSGIYFGDSLLWEPWLRVRAPDGQTGWVFGGFLTSDAASTEAVLHWRHQKRLQALCGPTNAQRLLQWAVQVCLTDTALAEHLRRGIALCDTLQAALRYGLQHPTPEAQPDLRWLSQYLCYFRRYRGGIALDYALLAREAQQTRGEQDDYFAQFCLQIYPIDSMESPLPVWVFPLSWAESASNLGAGYHRATLHQLDQAFQQAPLFRPEWERLKNLVLADVLDSERTYWQPLPKLLAELDLLLAQPPACLTRQEHNALALRRRMLARGMAQTDLRSGR